VTHEFWDTLYFSGTANKLCTTFQVTPNEFLATMQLVTEKQNLADISFKLVGHIQGHKPILTMAHVTHDYYSTWFPLTAIFLISEFKLTVVKLKSHYFISASHDVNYYFLNCCCI
jgi:hypothetical protein